MNHERKGNQMKLWEIIVQFIEKLEEKCDHCEGKGTVYFKQGTGTNVNSGFVKCPECLGCGTKLTKAGEIIVDFIKRHRT